MAKRSVDMNEYNAVATLHAYLLNSVTEQLLNGSLTYQQLVPEVTRLIVQLVRHYPVVDGTARVTARRDSVEPIVVTVRKLNAGKD